MSKSKVRTTPDLSSNISYNNDYGSWQYNVADHLKDKSLEDIRQHLKTTAFPFSVCMENWSSDLNFSSLVRNANAFNAKSVYYLGNKKIDRRGMVGCHNYTDVIFVPTIDEFHSITKNYIVVGADNVPGAIPLDEYDWKPNTMMVFGSESIGLTPKMQSFCKDIVYIKQYGSVRSINCATASGIMMNDFVSKFIRK